MKHLIPILFIIIFSSELLFAQNKELKTTTALDGTKLMCQIEGGDTILLAFLHDIWVFPSSTFKNKRQERFFWRTVRDVKRTLPYAKLISRELVKVNAEMEKLTTKKEQKAFLKEYEKAIFKKYENDLRKMSISQGRMLMKLIDRECNRTSYELIKNYKGGVSAFFWQGIARLFGSNLKSEYDAKSNEKVIERIILLVEAGQL
jgi:hypothetical protein